MQNLIILLSALRSLKIGNSGLASCHVIEFAIDLGIRELEIDYHFQSVLKELSTQANTMP